MAALGALSCSTTFGQTVVFGLASFSVSGMCSVDDSMCCTCTIRTTNTSSEGTETEVIVNPPFMLMTLFPGFFRSHCYDDHDAEDRRYERNDLRPWGGTHRLVKRAVTVTEECTCTMSNTLQSFLGMFFLISFFNLLTSCFAPATPQIPILLLPSPQDPPLPAPVLLQPPVLGSTIPVPGVSLPSDGCPRDEVLVQGTCSPLLESVPPCPPPQWVVLSANTSPSEGTCGTRLCGRGRVFLVSDQLCHDVREPGLCPDGRRLYITAYGSPVCDCYEGEFPDANGVCYPLFSQGPCPAGEIWGPDVVSQPFTCQAQPCPSGGVFNEISFEDGICYPLGSQGPCEASQLVGFSISRQTAVCTTLEKAGYETLAERARELDELYPRFAPADFTPNIPGIFNNRLIKRQVGNLVSDPVIPDLILNVAPTPGTILETPLLTQCRPGAQLDVNFKCRDVILGPNVDNTGLGVHAPPVPPLQRCPTNLCFNTMAQCVTCNQAVVDTCGLSATLNLQQTSCQAIAAGLG